MTDEEQSEDGEDVIAEYERLVARTGLNQAQLLAMALKHLQYIGSINDQIERADHEKM